MQTLGLRPLETLSFEPGICRKTFFSTNLTSLDIEKFETRSQDVIVYTEITPKVDRFNSIINRKLDKTWFRDVKKNNSKMCVTRSEMFNNWITDPRICMQQSEMLTIFQYAWIFNVQLNSFHAWNHMVITWTIWDVEWNVRSRFNTRWRFHAWNNSWPLKLTKFNEEVTDVLPNLFTQHPRY